ncbi:acyl-CoA synthetase [Pseudonocardia sp. GCM10023141]|uniref:acyl-CoA synthetase n=1 Tax=Pseudonocardia sp. GCM10023141 TaxID=3252653 RepID=UPI003620A10D
MNLGSFLTNAATRAPGSLALTTGTRQATYGELDARVDALAAGLHGLGLVPGDRVVLWMRNCPEFIESFFACWKLGLVAVPVNPRLRGVDVAFHAADSGATALIHSPGYADAVSAVDVAHRIGTGGAGAVSYDELIAANTGAADQTRSVADDDPAWLFYTSGTTGRPKGAVLTHANLTFVTVSWCADLNPLQPEDVVLHCAPLSHGAGFHALAAVARGATHVLPERTDPTGILAAIARHRVTAAWMVPTQIRMLLDSPELAAADLSSLTSVVYGGAPMYRSDLVEAIERIGPVFCQLYGQGEAPMTITYLRREEHGLDSDVLASAGIVRTGMELRIAAADDRLVSPGEPGEIQVRGPAVMAGYWQRPQESAAALRDGWLRTGDVGRLDERGYLHVLDRLKDMIITGGSNVYAREVEDVLLQHPAVQDAAVFGIPDRVWGEAVTAVVVGPDARATDELRRFCRDHLADYMRPKHLHVATDLPRNSYGKVLKRELRERYVG